MADQERTRTATVRPLSYVCQEKESVMLKLEMPGVTRDDIEITVDGDKLNVQGHRAPMPESARYVVRERQHGDFAHSFTIDDTIDRTKIDAGMENGVLTIQLHIREEEKPRKITVKTEE